MFQNTRVESSGQINNDDFGHIIYKTERTIY